MVPGDDEAEAWLGDEPLPDAELMGLCRGLPSEALHHETLAPKLKITRSARPEPPSKKEKPDEGPMLF